MVNALEKHFGDRLLPLSCKGLASLIVFRSRVSELVNLVDESNDEEHAVESIVNQILEEANKKFNFSSIHMSTALSMDSYQPAPLGMWN